MKSLVSEAARAPLEILTPIGIFVFVLLLGYGLRKYLLSRLARRVRETGSRTGGTVLAAVRTPFIVLWIMLAIYLSLGLSDLPRAFFDKAHRILSILATVAVAMVTANVLCGFVRIRAERIESVLPVTSLTENIIRIVVYGVGGMIILHGLGISITPILATLGVGGLAVALALKDTLSNFFAGFQIIANGQIRVGDYLKLDSGDEGHVSDISWRTTLIKTIQGNFVLIPNSKLTELIVTNFSLQEKDLSVKVDLGVHYGSDLEKVERVACEVAAEVMRELPGAAADFTPFIRYHTFADSSINFSVILRAREFADQFVLRHEFIKRIHRRFEMEGIVIPYPIRALNYEQEKAAHTTGQG
ncbi:MAG: mechanosensitive ion channel family protein [Thermodesulfobacteriota bacterium]